MANLPESATFDAGVYQIELTDGVIGGVNGISNLQAKALANRTTWLKQQVDALNALKGKGVQVFSTGNSYAGGDQAIHLKNIWQANTAITPGAFNPANWTKQLGAAAESALAAANPLMNGVVAVGTSTNLAREDHVHPSDTTRFAKSGDTVTGMAVFQRSATLNDLNTAGVQIQAANDAIIWFHRPGVYSVGFGLDANNKLVYGGAGSTLGSVNEIYHEANCPKVLTNNGYQKLASGLIVQWGSINISGGSFQPVTFPIAFPSAVLGRYGNWTGGSYSSAFKGTVIFGPSGTPLTTMDIGVTDSSGTFAVSWHAFGF